jgi:hypothetical protein
MGFSPIVCLHGTLERSRGAVMFVVRYQFFTVQEHTYSVLCVDQAITEDQTRPLAGTALFVCCLPSQQDRNLVWLRACVRAIEVRAEQNAEWHEVLSGRAQLTAAGESFTYSSNPAATGQVLPPTANLDLTWGESHMFHDSSLAESKSNSVGSICAFAWHRPPETRWPAAEVGKRKEGRVQTTSCRARADKRAVPSR